jgi:hypothetical protein
VPAPYPPEFRRDVVAVTSQGDDQSRRLRMADREDGPAGSSGSAVSVRAAAPTVGGHLEDENPELWKCAKQLE